jgi:ABC-type multidrug transport system fused ATPase/permease subunit
MREAIYSQDGIVIVAVLFLGMMISVEIGFRIRRPRRERAGTVEAIAQANAILVSMLGLLSLLLAFTFSAALQRFDDRSLAVVTEANAIGTTYLRAQLLPAPMRAEVCAVLSQYLDVRIREGQVDFTDDAGRKALLDRGGELEAQLWRHAVSAAERDGGPVTSGLYIQSLNDLIDASVARTAANSRHVPEIVIFLLFATVLISTMMIGFASGMAGHRPTFGAFVLMMLIALVVYLIIDLDRPRRGAIQVSQDSLLSLQRTIAAGSGPGIPSPSP